MAKIQQENYINIQGWMVTDLHLKGNELLIYAIIYGFSQDKEGEFNGGLGYLAEWTSTTKQSCINNLKSLLDKNLITKREKIVNGIKYVGYSNNFNGIKKSLMGIKKSLINNKYNNKNNIIYNQRKYKDLNKYYNNI